MASIGHVTIITFIDSLIHCFVLNYCLTVFTLVILMISSITGTSSIGGKIRYQDIKNTDFLNVWEGAQMPSATAQGFPSTSGLTKATLIKILLPAGCFYELHDLPRGKSSLPGLATVVQSQGIVSFKGHILRKIYLTCVCERQYLYPAACQSAGLRSSELPCYCVLPNLQRVQQSNSFSRKTKSPLFLQGGCKKRKCNLVPWDNIKYIFYYILL